LNRTLTTPIDLIRKLNISVLAGLGSLLISLLGMAAIALCNPDYLSSPWKNQYPDAIDYLTLAEGIATKGQFSRTADGRPDFLRTPLYPIILAACGAHRHPLILYLLQCGMLAASVAMVARTTRTWLGYPSALLATVLLWMEYRLHVMCFQAMSEIASLFFLISGLSVLNWPSFPIKPGLTLTKSLVAGALLGASVMIRPAILYLPLVFTGVAIVYHRFQSNTRSRTALVPFVSFPIAYLVLPTIWTLRNWVLFGIPMLTPVSAHNLVYFSGAGAWQFKYGVERFEAQDMIVKQFSIPPYTTAQNPYSQNRLSIREIEDSIRSKRLRILFAHPLSLVASSSIGIVKASMDHSLDSLGHLLNITWKNVGASELIRLRRTAWQRLLANEWPFLVGLVLYALQSVTLWVAVAVGVFKAFRNRKRPSGFVGLGLLLAYGYFIVVLFGIDATFRSTIVVLPALYLLAGYAISKSDLSNERPIRGSIV